jgi:hypothetical protein
MHWIAGGLGTYAYVTQGLGGIGFLARLRRLVIRGSSREGSMRQSTTEHIERSGSG